MQSLDAESRKTNTGDPIQDVYRRHPKDTGKSVSICKGSLYSDHTFQIPPLRTNRTIQELPPYNPHQCLFCNHLELIPGQLTDQSLDSIHKIHNNPLDKGDYSLMRFKRSHKSSTRWWPKVSPMHVDYVSSIIRIILMSTCRCLARKKRYGCFLLRKGKPLVKACNAQPSNAQNCACVATPDVD